MRKIKEYGLFQHYVKKAKSRRFLSEIMSLPFLPHEQIPVMFQDFCNVIQPNHEQGFHRLMEYLEATWVNSSHFPPSAWSVFGQAVRTNNDVEGWHHGLNRMVSRRGNENVNLNVYELVEVLYEAAQQVQTDVQLVTEEKLMKHQRKEFLHYQAKIFSLWDQYSNRELRPAQLVRKVAELQTLQPSDD